MDQTYIIAEIGQNHNGDLDFAKKLIDIAAMPIFELFSAQTFPGVNAVKFTKRDLDEEMTNEVGNRPYSSPNSFGATYREHREALEFSFEQHAELEQYAHSKGLDFIVTLCSPSCLELLDYANVDAIKIASRDVTNIPLLENLAKVPHKIIISTGMCTVEELREAMRILNRKPKDIAILHCVSIYPPAFNEMNARSITYLQETFPEHVIGYSDHSLGIILPVVAITLGAKIIEKHITLNRNMKGSDHAGSVAPDGLWRFVRDIRSTELALGKKEKSLNENIWKTRTKLARSVALRTPLEKGEVLTRDALCMLSPGTGLSWPEGLELVGKMAAIYLPAQELIQEKDFERVRPEAEVLLHSSSHLGY